MSKLSDYLDNIIRVVNQHAKLLDDVSKELANRPLKQETGEFFALLSLGFPYEQTLKEMGIADDQNHVPRTAKVVEELSKHNIDVTTKLSEQQQLPVKNCWEGVERFLKIVEVTGKVCTDLQGFQKSAETQLEEMSDKLTHTVSKTEHEDSKKKLQLALTKRMDSRLEEIMTHIKRMQEQIDTEAQNAMKRCDSLEQATLW